MLKSTIETIATKITKTASTRRLSLGDVVVARRQGGYLSYGMSHHSKWCIVEHDDRIWIAVEVWYDRDMGPGWDIPATTVVNLRACMIDMTTAQEILNYLDNN